MNILAHHELVIQSLLRQEEWRDADGDKRRTSGEIAQDWVEKLALKGPSHYRDSLLDADAKEALASGMAEALERYQKGEVVIVDDFQVQRDGICDRCCMAVNKCWRKAELGPNVSVRDFAKANLR